jgi:hypothetical protein
MKETFVARRDLPQTGWILLDVFDNYTAEFACQNCNFPHVRYVHELKHKKSDKIVRVGCVCAEHLTQDFATPRLREKVLRSLAGRRLRWPTLNWKRSHKGNLYLRKQGVVIVINRAGRGWSASYKPSDDDHADWTSVKGWYDTPEEAKLAAFDALYLKREPQAF